MVDKMDYKENEEENEVFDLLKLLNELSNDELLSELKMKGKIKFPLIVSIFSRDEKCGYLEAEYVVVVKR